MGQYSSSPRAKHISRACKASTISSTECISIAKGEYRCKPSISRCAKGLALRLYQGLCLFEAIFLALPPPRERADALRRECEPYSATALQSKVESILMVHRAKKATPKGGFAWWTIKDSNLGPTGYEPVALTN